MDTFRSGDVARITGVNQLRIRNWRKRGFLPHNPNKWQSWTRDEVVALAIMGKLADHLSPSELWPMCLSCVSLILPGCVLCVSPKPLGSPEWVVLPWNEVDTSEREVLIVIDLSFTLSLLQL